MLRLDFDHREFEAVLFANQRAAGGLQKREGREEHLESGHGGRTGGSGGPGCVSDGGSETRRAAIRRARLR